MLKKILLALLLFTSPLLATNSSFDVRTPSNVTAETLDKNFKGVLAGKGEHFKKAEKEHKVNASFLAAIAILESGNGTSSKARNRRNCFGLRGKSFGKVEDGIYHAAATIAKKDGYYYGRGKYTIARIASTYAPPKHSKGNSLWAANVIRIMKRLESSQ